MVSAGAAKADTSRVRRAPCIVLVGMMGAGKTTVGRELARRLHRRFVDSDHEICARTGVSVPVIFDVEGEAGFRRRESQVIDDLTQQTDLVLATGGGVVLAEENRTVLRERCTVIYLDVPPAVLWERTRHDRNRPLLQVEDPRGRIEALYRERDPLYRSVAHVVVPGGRGSAKSMLRKIEKALEHTCEN
ncbi:shikimate kinase [Denitromonas iodatirespirans]|uniref:Shikimate kinase n=1 Tax=Denitromonas iodatirespirans TaxID=2795389 RepID=A0A944HEB0_DENI1|nr:shikimate kinase [Denitromonas iodatirespirans]MBT0962741.1 shikimate kinase [Denitromonas iodatirespirans]